MSEIRSLNPYVDKAINDASKKYPEIKGEIEAAYDRVCKSEDPVQILKFTNIIGMLNGLKLSDVLAYEIKTLGFDAAMAKNSAPVLSALFGKLNVPLSFIAIVLGGAVILAVCAYFVK